MRKIISSLLTLLLCQIVIAQELDNGQLLEIGLPSPTAFELTKYGNVPVNESSGRISPGIPIYNYVAGKLSLPISLNYSGNGVKVDQLSSWTGINWNLNAGGVITRLVRGRPDEYSYYGGTRYLFDSDFLWSIDQADGSDDVLLINSIETNKLADTQVDIFNFSFCQYSGSFYLDSDLKPVLCNYDNELKIDLSVYNSENGIIEFIKYLLTTFFISSPCSIGQNCFCIFDFTKYTSFSISNPSIF